MSVEGAASADASADFDRCLELAAADPAGDDMFSTLISLWAYDLSRAELDRAREIVGDPARRAGRRPRRLPPSEPRGLRDARLVLRATSTGAVDELSGRHDGLAAMGREDEVVAAAWFVPNDPTAAMHVHLALARFMVGRRRRGGGEPRPGARRWRPRSTSRRARGAPPTRPGWARGCGSRPAGSTAPEAALADLQRRRAPGTASTAGSWSPTTQTAALEAIARAAVGAGGRGRR